MAGKLVLRKFEVNPESKDGAALVEVAGRVGGVISYFLTLIDVDPTTYLKCFPDRIEFREASLFGEHNMTIPLPAISGIVGGYTKPFKLLITAGVFFIGALLGLGAGEGFLAFFSLAISIAFLIAYILKKEMGLQVQNGGDKLWGLTFQRSVIENVTVDIDLVRRAVAVINDTVLRAHAK